MNGGAGGNRVRFAAPRLYVLQRHFPARTNSDIEAFVDKLYFGPHDAGQQDIADPVYEGKSMQGMIDLIRKGFFPAGSKVLYAHLGGVPAINGYSYTFRNG